jgi:hypothetical protein
MINALAFVLQSWRRCCKFWSRIKDWLQDVICLWLWTGSAHGISQDDLGDLRDILKEDDSPDDSKVRHTTNGRPRLWIDGISVARDPKTYVDKHEPRSPDLAIFALLRFLRLLFDISGGVPPSSDFSFKFVSQKIGLRGLMFFDYFERNLTFFCWLANLQETSLDGNTPWTVRLDVLMICRIFSASSWGFFDKQSRLVICTSNPIGDTCLCTLGQRRFSFKSSYVFVICCTAYLRSKSPFSWLKYFHI